MPTKITKELIISHLQDYYNTNCEIPKKTNYKKYNFPFGCTSIRSNFGSWNNALKEANIPLYRQCPIEVNCLQCNILFKKQISQIKKTQKNFCSSSCSAIYNNKYKTTGFRISKLELYLQEKLIGYNFNFNNRIICDGLELDIYIDELKVAFEINGIVHYNPIYGIEKYNKIIKRDLLKNKLTKDKGIILYTIKDESKKFSIKYAEEILEKIYKFIHKLHFKKVISNIKIEQNIKITQK
jgi:hypothetical protein